MLGLPPRAPSKAAILSFTVLVLAANSAPAALYSFTASGTISSNSSGDPIIPVGTSWAFELIYDTDAPDLDFEVSGSPDSTFGRFTNTDAPPALTFFHYRAGDYEVTIDDPDGFGPSDVLVTFSSVYAIDINVEAPDSFPPLAGGVVSFHADFNDFSSRPIFEDDGLPTNDALDVESFDESRVTLLPPAGAVTSNTLTSLAVTPLPEPSTAVLSSTSLLALIGVARIRRPRRHEVIDPPFPTQARTDAGACGAAGQDRREIAFRPDAARNHDRRSDRVEDEHGTNEPGSGSTSG